MERGDDPEEALTAQAGPFCTAADLSRWPGMPPAEQPEMASRLEVLEVQDDEGERYYPSRQLTDDGKIMNGLQDVLRALAGGTPVRWTWALWLAGTRDAFDGRTAWHGPAGAADSSSTTVSECHPASPACCDY